MLKTSQRSGVTHVIYGTDLELVNWEKSLLSVLARQNFCRVILYSNDKAIAFVGKPHNITAVRETYSWLSQKMIAVALKAREDAQIAEALYSEDFFINWNKTFIATDHPARWLNSYLQGMVTGIEQAMQRARRESLQGNDTGKALVPVMYKEVDDYVDSNFRTKKTPVKFNAEESVYESGKRAGRYLDIEKRKEISS